MRFIGLVLVLAGAAVGYFLAYRQLSVDQARTRLAQLLNIPGLAPSSGAAPVIPGGTAPLRNAGVAALSGS